MRPGVTIALTAVDRRRLGAIVGNRNVPQKHAWRAEIVLLTADGLGTVEIMRRTGKSKTCVWRWQERFAEETSTTSCGTRPLRCGSRGTNNHTTWPLPRDHTQRFPVGNELITGQNELDHNLAARNLPAKLFWPTIVALMKLPFCRRDAKALSPGPEAACRRSDRARDLRADRRGQARVRGRERSRPESRKVWPS
jgi:hypothetical protein